jgi:hypothetical protein
MPEREHLGRCRVVAASQHDDQAEYPADQQPDDLEQHPPSQPSGCPACRQHCRSNSNRVFEWYKIIECLAGYELSTVAVICGLISRARRREMHGGR